MYGRPSRNAARITSRLIVLHALSDFFARTFKCHGVQEGQEKGLHVQLEQARQEASQLRADLAASHALSASAERLRQRCMAADEAAAAAKAAIHQKVGAIALAP